MSGLDVVTIGYIIFRFDKFRKHIGIEVLAESDDDFLVSPLIFGRKINL